MSTPLPHWLRIELELEFIAFAIGLSIKINCIFDFGGPRIWRSLAMADRVVANFRLVLLGTSDQSVCDRPITS